MKRGIVRGLRGGMRGAREVGMDDSKNQSTETIRYVPIAASGVPPVTLETDVLSVGSNWVGVVRRSDGEEIWRGVPVWNRDIALDMANAKIEREGATNAKFSK